MQIMQKTVLASMLSCISLSVWADVVPNAGQLLQQQQMIPYQPQAAIELESATTVPPALASDERIRVEKIQITGNQSLSREVLHALVVDYEGKTLTLGELQQLAIQITQYYQQQGYPYSRAYLPAQNLSQGVVTIAVLEARYDGISYNNQSRTRNALIDATLQPLQAGQVITSQALEQQIKLLNRLDGVQSRNILSAGQSTGTSQLNVDILPTAAMTGYVGLDNYGNEYTREVRFNAGAAVHNPFGLGDKLSVDAMTSGKMHYGRVGYEATINGMGSRLGASYSDLIYELGKEYKALDAEGKAQQASIWLNQPVLLSNRSEVLLNAQYDYKQLEDDIGVANVYRHRDVHVGRLSVQAAQYDNFAGGGLNQLNISNDFGQVKYQNAAAKKADQATAQTQGSFYRAHLNLSRLQNLGLSATQLYTGIQAQYSPDNLDSSEQFSMGGAYTVAGYQNSVLSGSSGYYAVAELRQGLLNTAQHHLMLKVYVDSAEVKKQAQRWAGLTGDNRERISSAGLGMDWSDNKRFQVQSKVGFPIGATPTSIDKKHDAEGWLSMMMRF